MILEEKFIKKVLLMQMPYKISKKMFLNIKYQTKHEYNWSNEINKQ